MAQTQINASIADYNLMLNVFKGAGRWRNVSAPGSFDFSTLDADGYPTSLPAGGVYCNIVLPASTSLSRYFYIFWDGNGTLGGDPTVVSGNYSTSGVKVDISATSGSATFKIKILAVNSSSDYPHNIRMIADVDLSAYNAGSVFRSNALSILSSATNLRFLDTQAGAANGGWITLVNWADRKPSTYYSYTQGYWPPSKIVPTANITYDGSSKYTVTWSGQTGPLADRTQFIARFPAGSAAGTTTNLNGTGDITNATVWGVVKTATTNDVWALWTYDATLNMWLIDDTSGSGGAIDTSGTGLSAGASYEVLVQLCNAANVSPWFVSGVYWGDTNNGASDFPSSLATYVKNNLNVGLVPIFECGPNELGNSANSQTQYAWNAMTARNGGTSPYTITAAASGATTTLTIGTNSTQIGSLLSLSGMTGLTPSSGAVRVLTKPNSTQITVNLSSTGSASAGTATPQTFDSNNWYGYVASNIGAAITGVFGIGNKGVTYKTYCGFLTFIGGASALGSNAGSSCKLQSPYVTTRGGVAASTYMSSMGGATYIQPSFEGGSNSNMTIKEGQLAFEYSSATAVRKQDILNSYCDSTADAIFPITITNITPGNPTVVTISGGIERMRTADGETVAFSGITGNIGSVLNATYNPIASSGYTPTFTATTKTSTTVTVNVDTTGKTYSGGGAMAPQASLGVTLSNVMANAIPAFSTFLSTFGLEFLAYEGGIGPDPMNIDSYATIKGVSNAAQAVVTVGPNSWDYLYNTIGISGMTTTISGIAAGTLATLLNGNSYRIQSATASTIVINVDTSGVSAWASGGQALYVGSRTAVGSIRNNVNFCPEAYAMTMQSYSSFVALGTTYVGPSEFVLTGGGSTFNVFNNDILYSPNTAYRYQAMSNWFNGRTRVKVVGGG